MVMGKAPIVAPSAYPVVQQEPIVVSGRNDPIIVSGRSDQMLYGADTTPIVVSGREPAPIVLGSPEPIVLPPEAGPVLVGGPSTDILLQSSQQKWNSNEEYFQYVNQYYNQWYRKEIEELRRKLRWAQEQMNAPKVDPGLINQLNEERGRNTELQNRLANADAEIRRLGGIESRFQQTMIEFEGLQVQLNGASSEQARLIQVEASFSQAQQEIAYLKQQLSGARQVEMELQEALVGNQNLSSEVERLRAILQESEISLEQYSGEINSYYQGANAEVISLGERLAKTKEQLAFAEEEISSLRADVTKYSQSFSELQFTRTQLEQATKEIERLRVQYNEEVAHGTHITSQIDVLQTKLTMANEDLSRMAHDPELSRVSNELASSEKELIQLRNLVTDYQYEIDKLRTESEGYLQTITFLQQQAGDEGHHAYFGLEVADKVRGATEMTPLGRLKVLQVAGPARHAGLQPNDQIAMFDDKTVTTLADFNRVVRGIAPYSLVEISFERDGAWMTTKLQTRATGSAPSGTKQKPVHMAPQSPAIPISQTAAAAPAEEVQYTYVTRNVPANSTPQSQTSQAPGTTTL